MLRYIAVLAPAVVLLTLVTLVRLRQGRWRASRDAPAVILMLGISASVGLFMFLPPLALGAATAAVLLAGGVWLTTATLPETMRSIGRVAGWLGVISGLLILVNTVAVLLQGVRST